MFWRFVFAANLIVLIRYITLISYKIKVEQQLVNSYNSVFETDFFNFGMSMLYILVGFAVVFMLLTALVMFEKGFNKKIFNKKLLKILFWCFILPVMLILSLGSLYNAFISNVWLVSLKNILFVFYNIIILTGCVKLAYKQENEDEFGA